VSAHPLPAQRDAPIGGQAVLEGVMMRGVSAWAVAVRREDGGIALESHPLQAWSRRRRILRLPVVRGVVALVESLRIGFKALGIAAAAQTGEDEELSSGMWAGAVVVALALAVGLFFVVPVGLTSLIKDQLHSAVAFWLVEGLLRTAIFLGYLWLLSRQRDLRRVFEYHGAEHKAIACYEAGEPLEPESAQRFSRLHPRCGTSFLLVVMIVAIFVFAPLGLPAWYWLVGTRVLGLPLIAGLSFEVIKWAGRHRARRLVRLLMEPGMRLQRLTTREPDRDELAVAIAALRAVLAVEDPLRAAPEDRVAIEVAA
jgi:uncharacterized protein YqhQ